MGFDVPIDDIISHCKIQTVKSALEVRPDAIEISDRVSSDLFVTNRYLHNARIRKWLGLLLVQHSVILHRSGWRWNRSYCDPSAKIWYCQIFTRERCPYTSSGSVYYINIHNYVDHRHCMTCSAYPLVPTRTSSWRISKQTTRCPLLLLRERLRLYSLCGNSL